MAQLPVLSRLHGPRDLQALSAPELEQLAEEMRSRLVEVVNNHGGHLASNLGVVDLTIALHYSFDFLIDRLIWDTSHQGYSHKLLTGRNDLFGRLRQHEGCSGFSSRQESPYDLFDAGHAGTGISSGLGIAVGERAQNRDGKSVVVVGDAALATGMALEGLNHAGDQQDDLLVILNDNRMSIDRSVGALSKTLNRIRSGPLYRGLKREIQVHLPRVPWVGKPLEEGLEQIHEVIHQALVPGQIFEDFGFRYFGPIDGHDLNELVEMFLNLRSMSGPVLLHVLTNKGHGWYPAQQDPIKYHASQGFLGVEPALVEPSESEDGLPTYTDVFAEAVIALAEEDERIHTLTAAMPGGTGLAAFQERFPDRCYDVGIAEQHGTTFASGLAWTGLRPIFAVYSTFLQRGFDQVVHDVCLQRNPVVFALDRAGLVEDGPTHHGVFDVAYLRALPGMGLMAPADGPELEEMLRLAVTRDHPVAIRYPKCEAAILDRAKERVPVQWGRAEVLRPPREVTLLAYGSMVEIALDVVDTINAEWERDGRNGPLGIVNMRFAKPLDVSLLRSIARRDRTIITIEEHAELGGFGSAVAETVQAEALRFERVLRWGVPDQFIPFGDRDSLLRDLELDRVGIASRLRELLPELASSPLRVPDEDPDYSDDDDVDYGRDDDDES